jgi:glycosyltransferase involved in cell wall biosynthesis
LNRRVIANSRAAVPAADGPPPAKMMVVHGGVELDGGRPSTAESGAMPVLPAHGPLIGIIGTVHPIKGHEAFLRMAALAAPRLPDATFVIVGFYDGGSRYYRALLRLRRQLGLDQRVVFTGYIEQVAPVLDRLSAVVITSSTESLPRAALEAMAAARPVVAFDVGGVSELVQDGVTGWLIRFGDVRAMADAVCRMVEAPSEAARLGEGGRTRVRQSFQLNLSTASIEAILREVVAEGVVDAAPGRATGAGARGGTA